jgi:serine/threonine-protein kinase
VAEKPAPHDIRDDAGTLVSRDGGDDCPTSAASPEALARQEASTEPRPSGSPPTAQESGPVSIRQADASGSGPSVGGSGATSATSVAMPLETLRVQEVARTRAFLRLTFGLAFVISTLVAFASGDPLAKGVMIGGMGLVAAATGVFSWVIRDEARYTIGPTIAAAYSCILGAFCGIYYFGFFSPAIMILPFGIFFFGAAQSFRATLAVYVTCAIVLVALSIFLAVHPELDRGLMTLSHPLRGGDLAVVLAAEQVTLLVTFLIARASRKATLDAIEHHDRLVRGIAQREALLREAREDLERALKFGGLGRFTDATLGSFRLGKILGRGGMGEVYEATHIASHEPAAVKLLHTHVLADPDLVRRFMREARIAQALASPNVVRMLEIGGLDAPVPYIAMERLRGEDLADYLRRHRHLTVKKTAGLARQLGRGLVAAKAAGIIHRDLKPRNVFYAEEGVTKRVWKILDFGVSKLEGGGGEGTQTKDMLIGTPQYMAPEQATGGEVSYRTDLYALGVICYRALTGRPAFGGEQTAETLYQVVYQMPPRPSEVSRVPPEVDHVLMVAMAKDAAARFDSGEEIAAALEAAAKGVLAPELRARAEKLAEKHPWGKA